MDDRRSCFARKECKFLESVSKLAEPTYLRFSALRHTCLTIPTTILIQYNQKFNFCTRQVVNLESMSQQIIYVTNLETTALLIGTSSKLRGFLVNVNKNEHLNKLKKWGQLENTKSDAKFPTKKSTIVKESLLQIY